MTGRMQGVLSKLSAKENQLRDSSGGMTSHVLGGGFIGVGVEMAPHGQVYARRILGQVHDLLSWEDFW